jgi:methylenetetrahydrofolate dehydrogenase (NADP+)/methenyltetrahydrofolate cyclohydrolase
MSALRIDGTKIAETVMARLREEVKALGRPPCLVAVSQGDHGASQVYMKSQKNAAESLGCGFRTRTLPPAAGEAAVVDLVTSLKDDPEVTGIIVQLPLATGVDARRVQQAIPARKDVEGVSIESAGAFFQGRSAVGPCTALAAMECARSVLPDLKGREAVVIGRSGIVGKPLLLLLVEAHATVTVCHTRTSDLAAHTKRAEVLFVAAGRPGLLGGSMVRPGAVVIDVGTNRVREGEKMRTVGDVRFDEVSEVARAITPVPGGVGPVTVAMLMQNLVRLALAQASG